MLSVGAHSSSACKCVSDWRNLNSKLDGGKQAVRVVEHHKLNEHRPRRLVDPIVIQRVC